MAPKTSKAKKGKPKKATMKPSGTGRSVDRRHPARHTSKVTGRGSSTASVTATVHLKQPALPPPSNPVLSIQISSISGDTTIGDLIVAFPRTRDVLMKHGLRFDVEDAGYLYMTLNVFSAIHGVMASSLVQELHVASKELSPQPMPQQLRPVATAPTV
jgi:hypothetical protein